MNEALTVLVVDDNETDRVIARLFLEQAGYRVMEADSAESGLDLCSRTRLDLLLIDALLPKMDGFQMCSALRAIPEFRDTPIFMLSGLEEPEAEADALKAGATGFIVKARDWNKVVAIIRQHLA